MARLQERAGDAARLIAREQELLAVEGALEAAAYRPQVLLLEGEPGIGKTRLWEEALRRASERGCRVLSCRPAESETQLAFAALSDLLADVLTNTLRDLPDPQRRALEVALLLADPGDQPVDQRAVAMGFLSSLRRLADSQPLVVAVDDVQWLDSSSAAALEFALRRLRLEPVVIVLTLRSSEEGEAPLGLERALAARRLIRLRLGPLSLGALHRLLRQDLGEAFARPLLQRLLEASGGNPLFALELARALRDRGGRLGASGELPVPRRLDDLLYQRVAALPTDVQELLAFTALSSDPTVSRLERASGDVLEQTLQPARKAGVVVVDGERLRFHHPLFASACIAHLDDERRRGLHRRLAGVAESSEERARHLALATEGSDSQLAALLEEAATASRRRGAWLAAAELLEHARRLTPAAEKKSWARRGTTLADLLYHYGDQTLALRVADEVAEGAEPGAERALALALSCFYRPARVEGFEQALAEAGDDPALRARIALMAAATRGHTGDVRGEIAAAKDAMKNARLARQPELLMQALALAAFHSLWFSETEGVDTDRTRRYLAEAEDIEDHLPQTQTRALVLWTPKTIRASCATQIENLDEARRLYDEQRVRATQSGDDGSLNGILLFRADVEWRAGSFAPALELATKAYEVGERNGDVQGQAAALVQVALTRVILGRVDEARTALARARAAAAGVADRFNVLFSKAAAGVIESCAGDHAAVVRAVGTLPEEIDAYGRTDPAIRLWLAAGEEIEARIALGDVERAHTRVEQLEQRSRRLGRPRALGIALRGRGLLLAVEGNVVSALDAFAASLGELGGIQAPYERARTLLALGAVHRRAKQKRAARESLQAAVAMFEELGAAPWAEKARAELKRIGGRAPARHELTPTEQRVAGLVAEGLTNRDVAAALFVAPRTVEWNLTKIYAKLGVRSRAELARRLARM